MQTATEVHILFLFCWYEPFITDSRDGAGEGHGCVALNHVDEFSNDFADKLSIVSHLVHVPIPA